LKACLNVALICSDSNRTDQIIRHGVAELVRLDVRTHTLLEGVFADIAFEHADDCGTLLIGDAVERRFDIAVAGDRLAYLARADQAVVLHGTFGAA
jgi:hypothetical protein